MVRFSDDRSARQEILNVRQNVGMLDASTLGKFRIHGPDALNALQRVYVSDMSKMKADKTKYSAMCNEDGCIIDDGVVSRRGKSDYYFTLHQIEPATPWHGFDTIRDMTTGTFIW